MSSEAVRKSEIERLTGLKCRCPGFSRMTQVQCRGFKGQQLCLFECQTPNGFQTFPVGERGLCRCGLGNRLEEGSTVFKTDDEGLSWGTAACTRSGLSSEQSLVVSEKEKQKRVEQWVGLTVASVMLAGTFWFVGRVR